MAYGLVGAGATRLCACVLGEDVAWEGKWASSVLLVTHLVKHSSCVSDCLHYGCLRDGQEVALEVPVW